MKLNAGREKRLIPLLQALLRGEHLKIPKWLADFGLELTFLYYQQLQLEIYDQPNQPEWFDHRIDLYRNWPRNMFWIERGIFPRRHMFEGCRVLDLFCGDGFYSRYFYNTIAGHIDALDRNKEAIEHARRWHSHPKISYVLADAVKEDFPSPAYDIIVWNEGIEHLDEAGYEVVLRKIKAALGGGGVLAGSTPLIAEELRMSSLHHSREFSSLKQLRGFLEQDFPRVAVEETVYPVGNGPSLRRTGYFACFMRKDGAGR